MNRRILMLLAGTLVPALALIPMASAQTPDQPGDRHGQRPRPEGGGAARPQRHEPGPRAGNPESHPGGGARRQDAEQGAPRGAGNRGAASDENRARKAQDGRPVRQGQAAGAPVRADDGQRNRPRQQGQSTPRTPETAQGRPDRAKSPVVGGEDPARTRPNRNTANRGEDKGTPRRAAGEDRSGGTPAQNGTPRNAGRDNGPGPGTPRRVGTDARPNGAPLKNGARENGPRENAGRDDGPAVAPRRAGADDRRPNGAPNAAVRIETPVGPTGIKVGVGLGGGFLAPNGARSLDEVRRDRREVREGDRTLIREPGRTIVQERGRAFIVHDESDRFRELGLKVRRERRGNQVVDTLDQPGGIEIITYTDITGRLLRRVRRTRDGREFVLIDNGEAGHIPRYDEDVVVLPPPPVRIPGDRYVVDYRAANEGLLYETLIAPPLAPPPRRYTLDQIRYSPAVRNYVRSVDINTINFDSGAWDVPAAASGQLEALATAIKRALGRNPNSVFLVEGYTDATGNPDDNLSLSDRRAQSVAEILTKEFGVPPENLTTQGYGQQNPKEDTQGPSAANRRVVVRNITQLLAAGDQPAAQQ